MRVCRSLAWLVLLAFAVMVACRGRREHGEQQPRALESPALRAALVTYADIAYAAYADAAAGARALLGVTDRFLAAPSAEGLAELRRTWLAVRRPYQQSEVYRFYDGPIDRVEILVNTWPIDEGYLEGGGAEGAKPGIVDDARRYPELSTKLIAELNTKEGETSISTGYHVIEFLLWGRDTRADGPGDRPYTDFVSASSPLGVRRGRFLHLAVELLAQDLESVRDAWSPGAGAYRKQFLGLPPVEAFGLALKGMGSLSGPELGGERLTVAYETKDQENEHSCFSDNTVNDLADDALGIQNVCAGRYQRTDGTAVQGTGLCAAIAAEDAELGRRLAREIDASLAAVRAIPPPFDQAMLGSDEAPGRKAIQAAIRALERQTATLTSVAAAFDIRQRVATAAQRTP